MIEIKQVSQAYGTQDILKNVSMKSKKNESRLWLAPTVQAKPRCSTLLQT